MIIDDFEHKVHDKIKECEDKADFPQLERYGLTQDDLDDYLFSKQAIFDSIDERKGKYFIPSFLFILPTLVLSAITADSNAIFIGVALGAVVLALYFVFLKIYDKSRMRRLYDEKIEKYIEDVLNF